MKRTTVIGHLLVLLILVSNSSSQFDTTKISLEAAKLMLDSNTILQVYSNTEQSIEKLSYDIQDFKFDNIHSQLRVIYDYYEVMRIWAGGLSASSQKETLSKVEKLKKKTELLHTYFDLGEMIMSEATVERLKFSLPETRDFFDEVSRQQEGSK